MKYIIYISLCLFAWTKTGAQSCSFSTSPNPICDEPVTLSVNNPQPSSIYGWDTDNDGTIDVTGLTPLVPFPGPDNYTVQLFENNTICATQIVTVNPLPDPSVGIMPGTGVIEGNEIRTCSSNPITILELTNMSSTILQNSSYTIEWGDGQIDNYTNVTFNNAGVNASHTYTSYGYFSITVTVTSISGCQNSANYNYYNGNNPSIGLATPGNTVSLCSPYEVSFPITDYQNNPTGTMYVAYVSGQAVDTFYQNNVPATFDYTFTESSCGMTTSTGNYENAFDVQIVASNPCGSSTATVEPIEVSIPPVPLMQVTPPESICANNVWVFTDLTDAEEVVSGNPTTCTSVIAYWSISPGSNFVDWTVVGGNLTGSQQISVLFQTPGTYTIEMFINSQSCGIYSESRTIEVIEPPVMSFTSDYGISDSCAPYNISFQNTSSGGTADYEWSVSPDTGWQFINGTTADDDNPEIQFTDIGIYTVSLTGTNVCGEFTYEEEIIISGPPDLSLQSIPDFCNEASILFNDYFYDYEANYAEITSFLWSFPGGQPSSSTDSIPGEVIYNTPGTYTVSLEVFNACGSATASTEFLIEDPANVTLMGPDSICIDGGLTNFSSSHSGGSWSGPGISSSGSFNPAIAGTGIHELIYTVQISLCTITDTIEIEVLDLPQLSIGASDLNVCENGTPIDLFATPAGGSWSSSTGGVISNDQFLPASSGAGSYVLTYSYEDDFGCSNSEQISITIYGLPSIAASGASFCISNNIETLPSAFPSGGIWSGPGVVDPIEGTFSSTLAGGIGDHTLTYTYTNSNNCTNFVNVTVEVTPLPVITISDDLTLCIDEAPIDINAGLSPMGGVWIYNGSGLFGTIFDPAAAGIGQHELIYQYGNGSCQVYETLSITVNPLPVVSVSGQDQACVQVACLSLNASPAGGIWSSNNGGVFTNNCFNPAASGVGNYTLTYSFTDANGCENTATHNVEVYDIPQLEVADTFYCDVDGAFILPVANFPGGQWSGPGVVSNEGIFNPALAGGEGTYLLNYIYSDALNCTADIDVTVTVNPVPVVDIATDLEVCIDEGSIDLSLISTPAGGTFLGSGISGNLFDPALAGAGTTEIIYIYGQGSCFAADTMQITVFDLPVLDLSGNIDGICVSETSVTLSASPSGGQWTGNNGAIITGNIFNPNSSGIGLYELSYTYTDGNGCQTSETISIEVYDLPLVISSDITYCDLPGVVNLPFASPVGGIWTGPGVIDPNGLFDPAEVSGTGSYTLTYTYSDAFNCQNSTTINVQIVPPPAIDAGEDLGLCLSAPLFDMNSQASPAGGSWSGTALTGSSFNPAQAGIGIHELIYTVGTNNCQVWDTVYIEVYDLPALDISNNPVNACVAVETINLQASPSGGIWSADNGGSIIGNTFSPSNSGSGNYILSYTYTDGNACSNTASLSFEVYDLPEITVEDAAYCNQGGTVLLPQASPLGGTWSGPGIVDADNGVFDPILPAGQYTLTYTYTDANACSNSAEATITINEPAAISAGDDLAFCLSEEGIEMNLQASPAGGTWSGPGLTGSFFDPATAGVGIHTLTYTVGENNCQVWDEMQIEIFELPYIDISNNDDNACVSMDSIYLNASPIGGNWYSPDGGLLNGNIFLPASSGSGIYTLIYEYTNSNNCYAQASFLFTVNDLPYLSSNDSTYCRTPGLVNLPFASPVGGNWTGQGVTSSDGLFNPMAVDSAGSYPVYYSYTDDNGCSSSLQVNLEILDLPLVEAGPDTILCIDGGLYQLQNFSPATGATWSGTGIVDAINGVFDPNLSGAGTFTLELSFGNNNCQVSDQLTIEVIDWVSVVDAGPDLEICAYDEDIQLEGFNPAGGKWFGKGITDELLGTYNPMIAEPGTHIITYTFTDPYSFCTVVKERTIVVNPVPESDFMADQVACVNTVVNFTNTSNDQFQSDWKFGLQQNSSETNPTMEFNQIGNYEVILLTTNAYTCQDSIVKNILITETPNPSFALDGDIGCAPFEVNFNNQSSGYEMSFEWNFGNGEYSVDEQPGNISFEGGIDVLYYPVELSVSNLCGSETTIDTVQVNPVPQVNFGPQTNIDCSPMEVSFGNATTGLPEFFDWDLGNGNSTTDSIPEDQLYYAYEEVTDYTITLVATNACGSDTMQQTITVNPPNVDAFINVPELEGCQPFSPDFNNISSFDANYAWNFGDGNSSNDVNPEHTFMDSGEFMVTLKVTNNCNEDLDTAFIKVHPQPIVEFEMPDQSCYQTAIEFENQSQDAIDFQWDFGDSNNSNQTNPTHTYSSTGIYTVNLIAESTGTGCIDSTQQLIEILEPPVAAFTPSDTVSCSPLVVEFENTSNGGLYYTWDFGALGGSVEEHPTQTFTEPGMHTVSLQVEDQYQCISEWYEFDVFVNPQPEADFTTNQDAFCTPALIEAENTSSGYSSSSWLLNGNAISGTDNLNLSFEDAGTHIIQLQVSNQYGCQEIMEREIVVHQRPVANMMIDLPSGCAPHEVNLENMSSNTTSVQWIVEGQSLSNDENEILVFQEAGTYNVNLIATNVISSCTDTIFGDDLIEVLPSPQAAFTHTDWGNGLVFFENQSEDFQEVLWEFGDGNSSIEEDPQYQYDENGQWDVSLTVSNGYNCTDRVSTAIENDLMIGFYAPNAFSPEFGDGDVRVFKPAGLGVKDYVIEVFAPWGQQLWQSSAMDGEQPAAAWDGIFKGKVMPQGAYAWKATVEFVNGKREVYNGTVTLLR